MRATRPTLSYVSPLPLVLLVQPERDDREMYAECFREQRWRVITASAAHDALRIAPDADVIITDVLLPGTMDGVELIRRLKAADQTQRIPIIVLTAFAWNTERERVRNAGCETFLGKPYLPTDLVAAARRLLVLRDLPKPRPTSVRAPETAHPLRTSRRVENSRHG